MNKPKFFHYLNEHADILQLVASTLVSDPKEAHNLYLETVLKAVRELDSFDSKKEGFRRWIVGKMKEVFYDKFYTP